MRLIHLRGWGWEQTSSGIPFTEVENFLGFGIAKLVFASGSLTLLLLSFPFPHECVLLLFIVS